MRELDDEPIVSDELRAPFPWFGGKRRVAQTVWERFGAVATYNEPFAGSLAVLLGRPNPPRVETVNDLDCYLANFWRALQHDPDGVAHHADGPVNEADLHARHRWLVEVARPTAERVMTEPDFFDVKIAGWWVWGQCLWIGSGWCQVPGAPRGRAGDGVEQRRRPQLTHDQGVTVERTATTRGGEQPWEQKKRPASSRTGTSVGVHRQDLAHKRPMASGNGHGAGVHRRWQGGGQGGGSGVHAPTLATYEWSQRPDLSAEGGRGALLHTEGLFEYLRRLALRLRRVRVCCGDWRRVLTPSVTTYIGIAGVFLDPPYDHDLRERCYSEDHNISADVRAWALAHGDDHKMRIALCGYVDEHGDHMPKTWECVPWKAHGGYSRSQRGVENRSKERIWFSPHCLRSGLFSGADEAPA